MPVPYLFSRVVFIMGSLQRVAVTCSRESSQISEQNPAQTAT
jgi:hypothetical protein